MSNISLKVGTDYIIVNLSGQLQDQYNKSIYLDDDNFEALCVKDAEISNISEMTENCTGEDEIDLTACIGNSTGVSVYGIDCVDDGDLIKISNLRYSAARGTSRTEESGSDAEIETTNPIRHSSGSGGVSSTTPEKIKHEPNTETDNEMQFNESDVSNENNEDIPAMNETIKVITIAKKSQGLFKSHVTWMFILLSIISILAIFFIYYKHEKKARKTEPEILIIVHLNGKTKNETKKDETHIQNSINNLDKKIDRRKELIEDLRKIYRKKGKRKKKAKKYAKLMNKEINAKHAEDKQDEIKTAKENIEREEATEIINDRNDATAKSYVPEQKIETVISDECESASEITNSHSEIGAIEIENNGKNHGIEAKAAVTKDPAMEKVIDKENKKETEITKEGKKSIAPSSKDDPEQRN
jgi:hypothetical protein